MADAKISVLPASTVPLAGTEVLPVVQSGSTKQVSVANLTAGRAVAMASLNVGTGAAISNSLVTLGNNTGASVKWGFVSVENCGGIAPPSNIGINFGWNYTNGGGENNLVYGTSAGGNPGLVISSWNGTTLADTLRLTASNNITAVVGNFVQGTAAKGINFTANTPAAGMTSQLLNWYEEGTWTPTQGAGLAVVGAFSSTGKYTRVGRQITVSGTLNGATSIAVAPASILCGGLPFTPSGNYVGNLSVSNLNQFGGTVTAGTNIYSTGSTTVDTQILFNTTFTI